MRTLVLGFGLVIACVSAHADFIPAEPDNYAENAAIPDTIGVKLRNADYPPGHTEFDRSWRRIRAKTPSEYPYCNASTGTKVLGNDYSSYFNGYNYGLRAWFVEADNTPAPTSYIGFDIGWATVAGWSEGARVEVWANDMGGTESLIFNQVFTPAGAYTPFAMFHSRITRARVTCWDNPGTAAQKAFVVDNFQFVDARGTAFAVGAGETLRAPNGMALGGDDSLGGEGSVLGNVSNGGSVGPGASPGELTIDGDYQQTADGELVIEIAGSAPGEFDVLNITGQADLAGTLRIELDGYAPPPGEQFLVMKYASHLGGFGTVLPPGGLQAQLDYDAPGGLTVTLVPEPATLVLLALGACLPLRRRRR